MSESKDKDKIELFFNLASKTYEMELERLKNVDDKAFKILSVSGILMALLPFFFKVAECVENSDLIIPGFFILIFLVAQAFTWFYVRKVVALVRYRMIDIPQLHPDQFLGYSLDKIYLMIYNEYQPYIEELSNKIDVKSKYLKRAICGIEASFFGYFFAAATLICLAIKK